MTMMIFTTRRRTRRLRPDSKLVSRMEEAWTSGGGLLFDFVYPVTLEEWSVVRRRGGGTAILLLLADDGMSCASFLRCALEFWTVD
jgi:hypothetical protein